MVSSEDVVKTTDGKEIGYKLEGIIVGLTDCSRKIEVRPQRTKTATITIEDCRDQPVWRQGDAKWWASTKVQVLVLPAGAKVIVED